MSKRRKKRAVTLIEIMIVILLIGLIGGALAVNMRGSLDKGRVFKTQTNCERVYDILMMEHAKGVTLKKVVENKRDILSRSPLVKNGESLLTDAWGQALTIDVKDDDLVIFSQKAKDWENAH